MPASKAQQKAQNKWIEKTYDRINLTVAKGKKETIQAHAVESVNRFINEAIDEKLERDRGGTVPQKTDGFSLPPDMLEKAKTAAQAQGEDVEAFLARAIETQASQDATTRKLNIQWKERESFRLKPVEAEKPTVIKAEVPITDLVLEAHRNAEEISRQCKKRREKPNEKDAND